MARHFIIESISVGVALAFLIGNGVKSDAPSGKDNTPKVDEKKPDERNANYPYNRYPRDPHYGRPFNQYPYDRRDYVPPADPRRYYNGVPNDPRQPYYWPPYDRRYMYPTYQRYGAPPQYDPRYSYYPRPPQMYHDPRYDYRRAPDGSYYRAPYDYRYDVPPQRPMMHDRRYDGYSYDPETNRRGYGPYGRS